MLCAEAARAPLSDVSIGDYHVILWTSVLLVVLVLAAVYALLDMGSAPLDAALKASVQDKRSGLGGGGKQKQ